MISRFDMIVWGKVQGVGFRWFVLCNVETLGNKGFVEDLENDEVHIVAEGNEDTLLQFAKMLQKVRFAQQYRSNFCVITKHLDIFQTSQFKAKRRALLSELHSPNHRLIYTMKTKKELKDEYKQIKHQMGVFRIRNKTNGKFFIGRSVHLDAMWNRSKMQLNWGNHPNIALQHDWKLFGESCFTFEVVSDIKHKENTNEIDYQHEIKLLEEMIIDEMTAEEIALKY